VIFVFSTVSYLVLGPIQAAIPWVLVALPLLIQHWAGSWPHTTT